MTSDLKIAGILLAAGDSSRMEQPKALLSFNGSSFIDTILDHLSGSGCDPVLSVLGHHGDVICQQTDANTYKCFSNPQPQLGMLSSLKIAIEHLPESCQGFILSLVDHPAVKRETYTAIVQAAKLNPNKIIIPQFYGQNGHPVFFGRVFFQELLNAPNEQGARIVVHQHLDDVHFLHVEDTGILQDIDTPEEYKQLAH